MLTSNALPAETDYFSRRRRLLSPPLSTKRLSLSEIRRAGRDLAGDPGDIRIYGMRPVVWYLLGFRILGRTAVEVTRDQHAAFIAGAVADTLRSHGIVVADVIDPFVGSGNLLFHFLRATHARRGVGFDTDKDILASTRRNFRLLKLLGKLGGARVSFHGEDWSRCLYHRSDRATLFLVAPPWGEAFRNEWLDIRKTSPPVATILAALHNRGRGQPPAFAMMKLYPKTVDASINAIRADYDIFDTVKASDPSIANRVDYLLLRLA